MNSTIKKTFYTCSRESLFLRHKKISKKAAKIGGFLHCSLHMFLGNNGWFWKINLGILRNHIMKNFQLVGASHTFSFESSKLLLDFCLADSRILYFWQVLESIHRCIIEPHTLQCLFVRQSNKQQRMGMIVSNFTSTDLFIFYNNQVLLGVVSQCSPPSCTLQERLSSPLQFGQKEKGTPYSHRQSRNMMMNTFIIIRVNISSTYQR